MFVLFALSSAAPFAAAATSTAANACFCYVDDKGATKTAGATDDASCATLCAKNGTSDAGHQWAKSFAQYPSANLRCWEKQTDCEKDLDGDTSGPEGATIDGQWSYGQPAECLEGSHYCYSADTIKTYLQVEIAGVKSVVNFADYVGLVYQYLMGFSMTVAIVFLMIGGLRYVLGASSGDVTKAKKMMTNAVEGFVLLMFAYVILYTVNPQLLKLQVPKLPMLRQVTIVSGNDCGTIMGLAANSTPTIINSQRDFADTDTYGEYAIVSNVNKAVLKFEDSKQRGDPRCGVDAEVLAGADGAGVAEGTTCQFSYCDAPKGCAAVKDKAECVLCQDIGPNDENGIVPSGALCSALDPKNDTLSKATGGTSGTYNMCGYSQNPSLTTSNADIIWAGAVTGVVGGFTGGIGSAFAAAGYAAEAVADAKIGTCAYLEIKCTPTYTCKDYDDEKALATGNNELDDLESTFLGFSLGAPNIYSVCAQNPCGVAGGCEVAIVPGWVEDSINCVRAGAAKTEEECKALYRSMYEVPLGSSEYESMSAEYRESCSW